MRLGSKCYTGLGFTWLGSAQWAHPSGSDRASGPWPKGGFLLLGFGSSGLLPNILVDKIRFLDLGFYQ
jgi:hypothetical protein